MAKRVAKYKNKYNPETGVLTKQFQDAEGNPTQAIDVSFNSLPDEAKEFVAVYGLKQILADCHSGITDTVKIFEIASRKAEDLKNGVIRRVAEGGMIKGLELTIQAFAKVQGISEEESRKNLERFIVDEDDSEDVSKQKKAVMRKISGHPDVKAAKLKLQGKDAPAVEDLSDIFATKVVEAAPEATQAPTPTPAPKKK